MPGSVSTPLAHRPGLVVKTLGEHGQHVIKGTRTGAYDPARQPCGPGGTPDPGKCPEDARGDVRWRLALAGMGRLLDDLGFDLQARLLVLRRVRCYHPQSPGRQ